MSKLVAFEGLSNTRDLGGMPAAGGQRVCDGVLYRSGQLSDGSQSDMSKLATMNIGAVFDFRSAIERDEKPDPAIAGVRNVHLPIIQDVRTGITRGSEGDRRIMDVAMGGTADKPYVDRLMQDMYAGFVTDPSIRGQYARFVDEAVAEVQQGAAVLWHCTAGKDRAGFATVILLEALGVPRDEIVADYLQTNACLAGTVEQLVAMLAEKLPNEAAVDTMRHFFFADESYLRAAYDATDEQFGSFAGFLEQGLCIDGGKRAKMQKLLLQ